MHRVINHLVQLQELTLIREQEAFMKGDRLGELDKAISGLRGELPPLVKTRFSNLQKKDLVAVVPASKGVCSTCGMKLPISLVQAVRAEKQIQHCPSCARILYYTDTLPRSMAKKQSRVAPRKIGMDRFSCAELMISELESTDKEGAIRELATRMEEENFVEHADKLVEAALRREAIIPTAVDQGLAFPHVRGVEGGGVTLGLGISTKGIDFALEHKGNTHIIFFVVIPTAANAFYLKLLAGLAETFMQPEAREKLCAEKDQKKLWKALKRLTKKTIV
jgi:mannitol/fructose-specific phosphotransferase system IIA component (Ntr-type)